MQFPHTATLSRMARDMDFHFPYRKFVQQILPAMKAISKPTEIPNSNVFGRHSLSRRERVRNIVRVMDVTLSESTASQRTSRVKARANLLDGFRRKVLMTAPCATAKPGPTSVWGIRTSLLAFIGLLFTHVNAVRAAENTVPLQNFSPKAAASLWKVENGSVRIADDEKKSPLGDPAVRMTYTTKGWQVVQLFAAKNGLGDWRGADALEWDMYVEDPGKQLAFFRIDLMGQQKKPAFSKTYQQELPSGVWMRFSVPLRRAPGMPEIFPELDRSAVQEIRFRLWPARPPNYPENEISIFVANMRLVSTSRARLESVELRGKRILSAEYLAQETREKAKKLVSEAKTLAFQVPRNRKDWEALSENVLALEDKLKVLSEHAIDQAIATQDLENAARLATDLG